MGSVRQLVDPTGQLALTQSFDPFGNVLVQGGEGNSGFGYTGEQVDSTELVYLRARYYNPTIGRFLTPDPTVPDPRRSIGWNRYTYGYNNPVRYTDPSGKNPLCLALVAIDGPIPAGDIACAALLAYTLYAGITIAQNVDIPSGSPPGFKLLPPGWIGQQPGFTLDETFNPCYLPGSNIGRSDMWRLPPFSVPQGPTLGDVFHGMPLDSGVPPLVILTAGPTSEDIAIVEEHLKQFGYDPPNSAMIKRLKTGKWTAHDQRFFAHELIEAGLMAKGMGSREAHLATLRIQGIPYEAGYEAELYHPDVIKKYPEYFHPEAQRRAGLK